MSSKYYDVTSCMQVIGDVFINLSLLDDERYHFNEEDFPQSFHKILFGSMYNLHLLGAKQIAIEDFHNTPTPTPNPLGWPARLLAAADRGHGPWQEALERGAVPGGGFPAQLSRPRGLR